MNMKSNLLLLILCLALFGCVAKEIDFFENNKGEVDLFNGNTLCANPKQHSLKKEVS